MDETTEPKFVQGSDSDTKFLQAACNIVNDAALDIDGVFGQQTSTAYADLKAAAGMASSADIWDSVDAYLALLDKIATAGFAGKAVGGSGSSTPVPPAPTPTPPPPPAASCPCGAKYTVQPGDTLSAVASSCGQTVSALQSANGIADANVIFAGQVLSMPGC
jgi:LysM domain